MKQFKQLVKELPAKKVVFAFGRFQPPTSGHALLVAATKHIADKQGADHIIYASKTQDKKSNPLPVDRKVYYLKRMFPGANFVAASADVPTFIQAVKQLNKRYKELVMIAGSDRVAEYQKILNKYNGKDFKFDSIEVVSAGERDPDAEGASGMSGTKMREAAKKGDFTSFKKGLPSTLTTIDAKRLMNEIREGMGLEQIREKVEFEKDEIREAYHNGQIYNVGDVVQSSGQIYKIEKRGSNHLLLREQSGGLVNKWLQDVEQSDKEFVLQGTLQEMKYTSTDKIKIARIIAGALGVDNVEDMSNAEQLVNAGLRKVRSKPMRPEYMQVLHKMLQTADEAGIKWDRKLHQMDIEEGVKQPNGTDKVGDASPVLEVSKETLKSYIAKSMGSKSAADFTRGVKMAQGSGGEEELRKKSEKRSAGIHTAIKKLTKEELRQVNEMDYGNKDNSPPYTGHGYGKDDQPDFKKPKKASKDPAADLNKLFQKAYADKKKVTEETLDEGKMGQLSADIGSHIDKHVDDYKTHGGAEHLMSKIDHTAKKIASQHGLEHKHAHKFVSDYVEKKLHEALEEGKDYSVTVTHYADGKHTNHEYTVKNANDRRHAKHIAMQRHGKKIGTLKQGEQYSSSNTQVKELGEQTQHISDLLEQIATAAMMGKDTLTLKKKLAQLRHDPVENESDVEAEMQDEPVEKKIGQSMTAPHETDNIRKQKIHYATEEVNLDEDQATAEYKVKTYYDNATGTTKTRKIRPHIVSFKNSKKNGEPEIDQPGEDLKNEDFAQPAMAGDMGGMPGGGFDGAFHNGVQSNVIDSDAKKKLKNKKALGLKEEDEEKEDHEEDEHDGISTESDLEDMANEVKDIEDIIDVYDDHELELVDDETGEKIEVKEPVEEETLNEVLSRIERMRAKIRFAKTQSKRSRKIKIALKSRSSTETINARARKLAVKLMKNRLAKKPLNKLSVSEKERIEKVIQRRKAVIGRLAMKLVPRIRKIEQTRLGK